jgi:hypothetical protein
VPLNIQSGAGINCVFWIKSLEPKEEGSTQRVLDDLEPFFAQLGLPFEVVIPKSGKELLQALAEIEQRVVQHGAKPLIHFDTHGDSKAGLYIVDSHECVGWEELADALRSINVATGNNLCVVSAACFGFYVALKASILKPVPFYLLIGPPESISFGYVESALFAFYQQLFQTSDIVGAYDTNLSGQMKLFHSQKMLVVAIARYFRQHCMGKAANRRIEGLVTKAIAAGHPSSPASLRNIREKAWSAIKPSDAIFQKYASDFLVGKTPGVTFDDVMDFVHKNAAAHQKARKPKA